MCFIKLKRKLWRERKFLSDVERGELGKEGRKGGKAGEKGDRRR
jgi:hypothetical protein